MTRRLAVVLVTVLACGALSASAAVAHEFHFESSPSYLTSEANSSFGNSVNAAKVKCAKANFIGTTTGTVVSQVVVHPVYMNCVTNLESKNVVEIFTQGCDYVFAGKTESEHGRFSIQCEAGKKIEYKVEGLCTAKFSPQTAAQGLHYVNAGSGKSRDIVATLTASGLDYELSGAFCSLFFGNGEDGSLQSSYTARAYQDTGAIPGPQVGTWIE